MKALADLLFVPHGASAQNRHLCHGVLLQSFQGVAFWSKQLSHEVKLERKKKLITVFEYNIMLMLRLLLSNTRPCNSIDEVFPN